LPGSSAAIARTIAQFAAVAAGRRPL